jgi:hypothetical protein
MGMLWIVLWYSWAYRYGLQQIKRDILYKVNPTLDEPNGDHDYGKFRTSHENEHHIGGVALSNQDAEDMVSANNTEGGVRRFEWDEEKYRKRLIEIRGVIHLCLGLMFVMMFCQVTYLTRNRVVQLDARAYYYHVRMSKMLFSLGL